MMGRVVLITGGSHGLGSVLVEHLARAGARVTFTFAAREDAAEALTQRLRVDHLDVDAVKADATDFALAHSVVDRIVEAHERLDVLVNNVGGADPDEGPLWTVGEDVWDRVIALNLKSCFNYTHAAADHFRRQRSGTIVNIGSINGLRGREGQPAYTAAKAAVLGFTKTTAKELGPYGVNVNMVATGYIDTVKQRAKVTDEHRDRILRDLAIKHLIQPEEVARAVAFLAGPDATHMTGAVLRLDSGEYI